MEQLGNIPYGGSYQNWRHQAAEEPWTRKQRLPQSWMAPQKHRIPKLLKNHEEPEADISMQKLLTLSKTRVFPQLHKVKGSFI